MSARAEAGATVYRLARGIQVAEMPGGLLDHVENDPARIADLVVQVAPVPPDRPTLRRRCSRAVDGASGPCYSVGRVLD